MSLTKTLDPTREARRATMTGRTSAPYALHPGAIAVVAFAALACVASAVAAGPSWSWDRAHYHVYAGLQWLDGRLGQGFLPAGAQTFLNPLAHVPADLMRRGGLSELAIAVATAVVQSLCVIVIWLIARDRSPRGEPGFVPALAAGFALATPVFVSQLGTSYVDATTGVLVLAGAWAGLRAGDPARSAIRWSLLAGLLLGAAAGLKLSNAPAALAAAVLVAWPAGAGRGPLGARLARATRALAALSVGGVLGAGLAMGDWAAQLYRGWGNPVYPMMNALFDPAPPPPEALVAPTEASTPSKAAGALRVAGGRFVPDSMADLASFPLRIADPRLPASLAYVEWHAPDPRLLVLAALWIALAAAALARRGAGRPAMGRVVSGGAGDRGSDDLLADGARGAFDAPLLAYAAVWGALWLTSSANGRYGLAWLMLLSVPIAQAAGALLRGTAPGRVSRRVAATGIAVLLAAQAVCAFVLQERTDVAEHRGWSEPEPGASLPATLREQPWLHVTTGTLSWSYLLPAMHPDSAFSALGSACDACPTGLRAAAAAPVLRAWAGRARLLAPVDQAIDGRPRLGPDAIAANDVALAPFDLRVDGEACEVFTVRPNPGGAWLTEVFPDGRRETRPTDAVASCPLVAAPGAAGPALALRRRHDAVFAVLESACVAELGHAGGSTRMLGAATWARDYPVEDIRLVVAEGRVRASRLGGPTRTVGRVDALLEPGARVDCGPLRDRGRTVSVTRPDPDGR